MTNPDPTPPEPRFDDETLAAFVDGRLDAATRREVERVLAEDPALRADVADLVHARDAADEAATAPAGLADRILADLPAGRGTAADGRAPMPQRADSFRLLPLAAAAVLLAGLALFALSGAPSDDPSAAPPTDPIVAVRLGRIAAAAPAEGAAIDLPAPPEALGTGERYLAHLAVDKPTYRPGERVFGRVVVLEAFRRVPAEGRGTAYFELKSPKGDVVEKRQSEIRDGVAGFGLMVPRGFPGGTFTLVAHVNDLPPTETTFDIHDFRAPRIKTDLQFERKAYGPGEQVVATLEAERAEGGIPAGASVTAVARVDGTEVFRKALALDAIGRCRVRFPLPKQIANGEGTLALVVADGGVQETAAKTIPIVVSRVAVRFFPEGGDLVAGVPCGVYFDAKTPKQEPADVRGRILDDEGLEVATFETLHEGRGRLALVPRAGRTYHAVIDEPAGVDAAIALPAVKAQGISLTARADTFEVDEPIRVALAATEATTATVGVFVRERRLAVQTVHVPARSPVQVALPIEDDLAGVLRVTVFDTAARPVAERLVFRQPARVANIELVPDVERATPRASVHVRVRATDETGRPVRALVGLSATDDAVLTQPEPRKRAPRLRAQALLGCEVQELMDPAAYLVGDAQANRNVDLLLGTQGWRRFAFSQEPDTVVAELGDAARRALAWSDEVAPEVLTALLRFNFSEPVPPLIVGGRLRGIEHLQPVIRNKRREDRVLLDLAIRDEWRRAMQKAGAARPPNGPARGGGEGVAGAGDGGDVALPEAEEGREAPPADLPPRPALAAPPAEPMAALEPAARAKNVDRLREFVGRKERWLEFTEKAAEKMGGDVQDNLRRLKALALLIEEHDHQYAFPVEQWARVYAHVPAAPIQGADRTDFTETVYWNAGAWTDANGELAVSFRLADGITTVRVRADAVTATGGLGAADAMVEVRRPLYVEPKFPLEVTAGDRVALPLAITNGTAAPVEAKVGFVEAVGFTIEGAASTPITLPADGSARHVLPLRVDAFQGTGEIVARVTTGTHADTVRRTLRIVPAGYPIEASVGGVLERRVVHEFTVAEDVDASSVRTEGAVYPTPLASLQDALAGLLREPHGCFEQTSSTNYPNVMVLQYLQSHEGAAPALLERATALLKRGYARLTSYECKKHGYEWFGGDPGHEALTAYGVLQFRDMAQVMGVDTAMLERTRSWLLARRDGKGGFQRNSRALDSFGRAPQATTDAYIVWSLVESGEQEGLDEEIALLRSRAKDSEDSYLLALAANVAWQVDDRAFANALLGRLAKAQEESGAVGGALTSITRSGGDALAIETTSLALLAWLRSPAHTKNVERAMRWLAARCKGGRFGSTQSTVLALRAIIAYDAARATAKRDGVLRILLDGEQLHQRPFKADQQGPIDLPDLSAHMTPGKHRLELVMDGGTDMPYSFTLRYNAKTPVSAADAAVEIETRISTDRAREGEPVDIPVTVRNTTDAGIPMVTAIVGLPGGVEVRTEQLKELVKQGKIDFVELRGRDVVLYWRSMAPGAIHELELSAIAAVPGTYEAAASRAYLYYTDEAKTWVEGLRIAIDAR